MLDRETSAVAYFALAAYLAVILGAALFSGPASLEKMQFSNSEGPLAKNTKLQLLPGETYGYEVEGDFPAQQIIYRASKSPGCRGLLLADESGSTSEACVLPDGTAEGSDASNMSLGNGSMLVFSPWMLAASDSLSWKIDTATPSGPMQIRFQTAIRSLGSKNAYGRPAYKIEQDSELGGKATMYVDKEKRVLLYLSFGNSTARLVSAPFQLNASQAPEK
jgi:hypothetical protein